jgi:hypothetical protein
MNRKLNLCSNKDFSKSNRLFYLKSRHRSSSFLLIITQSSSLSWFKFLQVEYLWARSPRLVLLGNNPESPRQRVKKQHCNKNNPRIPSGVNGAVPFKFVIHLPLFDFTRSLYPGTMPFVIPAGAALNVASVALTLPSARSMIRIGVFCVIARSIKSASSNCCCVRMNDGRYG